MGTLILSVSAFAQHDGRIVGSVPVDEDFGNARVKSLGELDKDALVGIFYAANHDSNPGTKEFAGRAKGHLLPKIAKSEVVGKVNVKRAQVLMGALTETLHKTEKLAGKPLSTKEWRSRLHSTFSNIKPVEE